MSGSMRGMWKRSYGQATSPIPSASVTSDARRPSPVVRVMGREQHCEAVRGETADRPQHKPPVVEVAAHGRPVKHDDL